MIYRSTSVFELDRPVAVKTGLDPSTAHSWAVGYTPSYVVGVWLGNSDGTPMQQIDDINGAAPLWNVLTRLVGEDSTKAGWELPRGIVSVEVCDPSGLLPTEHCPNIVSELYLEGTEPAQVDNLYQPFRVNKETGKIATLHTPLDQVEELVFLIPPPEAEAWAELVNLDQPPREYDILADGANDLDEGGISSPGPFELSNGRIWITGTAETENFEYYRLQFGKGLNPTVWYQIGDDVDEPVREGTLGLWDTAGLNGLYTLQLMVIDNDGVLSRSYQHITIDNQPPQLEVLNPKPGQTFRMGGQASVLIEARADDPFGISKVEILVDDKIAAEIVEPPYLLSLPVAEAGEHAISVLAYDLAGNRAESTPIRISILP
jgi:membrane carboxypeptidase/penicillin-binding protein PbpC